MSWVGRTRPVQVDYGQIVAALSVSEVNDATDGGIVFGLVSSGGVEHAKKSRARYIGRGRCTETACQYIAVFGLQLGNHRCLLFVTARCPGVALTRVRYTSPRCIATHTLSLFLYLLCLQTAGRIAMLFRQPKPESTDGSGGVWGLMR